MTATQQNTMIQADLLGRYEHFGIQDIQPDRPLDVLCDQIIPGRARMLSNFGAIERYRGTVEAIDGQEVELSDGTRLSADVLLWGTGYRIDLSYFDDPRIASIRSLEELRSRCGCIFRSLDAPDLYFPAVGLDGIGSTPRYNALIARSTMSHVLGTARLDMEPLAYNVNHFDIARYLAPRDPGTYTEARGWNFYRDLALTTPDDEAYPLP